MEANARLYTLNYDEARTYLWATVFVACNLLLPQVVGAYLVCKYL